MSWSRLFLWVPMAFLAILIGAYALSFFFVEQMGGSEFKEHFETIPWTARLHILPAGVALIIGAFQFHGGLRTRWIHLHRYAGRAYVMLVLVGAVAGLLLAWYAPRDAATRLGFASLAVVWFYSTSMAFYAVRSGNIEQHKQWMIRSYALTLAAVTLRIQLGIFQAGAGLSFEEAYAIVAWFCWVPNLIIAEWVFNRIPIRNAATVPGLDPRPR